MAPPQSGAIPRKAPAKNVPGSTSTPIAAIVVVRRGGSSPGALRAVGRLRRASRASGLTAVSPVVAVDALELQQELDVVGRPRGAWGEAGGGAEGARRPGAGVGVLVVAPGADA